MMSEKKEAKEREVRSLTPWNPFAELDRWPALWEGFFPRGGRVFGDLFRDFPQSARAAAFVPAMDVSENDSHYTITVEIPGVRKDDVHVELRDDMLVIQGEKKSEREEKKERGRYIERSYGSFNRAFTLPGDADGERLEASFKEGVLTVRIPRREALKPKQIAIKG
ncbi:MAG TPA: Hsp20/alpha crystallin family protein [Myxococcota bacterium]|nr:Hsp20/alpha crystallin family protein [Myxococcota bacterium]